MHVNGGTPVDAHKSPSTLSTLLGYALMVALAGGALWAILTYGNAANPVHPAVVSTPAVTAAAPHQVLPQVLLALLVIILTARAVGTLFQYIGQPRVIGEVVAGIVLGPSLLGRIAPDAQHFLLPNAIAPHLGIVAQVGVILFMFLVGLELDSGLLRGRSHTTLAISHASIVLPFLLGAGLALTLHGTLAPEGVGFTPFCLFMGVSMSVTAFPVLARILTDRNLSRSRLGVIALSCAAVDDVSAWCMLAAIVSVVRTQGPSAWLTVALTVLYGAFMLLIVEPRIRRWIDRRPERAVNENLIGLVLVGLLVSALITESIGIHALFGAFLLGAIIPHDSQLARSLEVRLHDLVVIFLLPAYFAFTGLRTRLSLLDGWQDLATCALILLVACLGKFGGSALAARFTGLSMRDSAAIGVLMNTRGLMELVVLNVGLDLGVISPRLFAMLVVMAVVTTMMTAPLLNLLLRHPEPS